MSEQQPDNLVGKRLGDQYEILDEIGRGGMATVYRARQISINRTVAIKVLPPHFLHDPGFFERFEREVDVIAHLEHPHILPIYDYGKDHNVPYIVMRYLGGGSMAQMIRRGVPKLEDLDKPFIQVSQALDHAHRQGIIHRDLKPGNIMLDENGNAYLSDFGIARVLGSNLTGSQIIGTPAYMSPEQANGFPLDARSDIYSLGIVLFEMITGQEPYQAETPMAMLLKHINEPMPPLTNYRDDIPNAVEAVIAKATMKDPNQRYPSASDMAQDFTEAIHKTTLSQRTIGRFEDSPTIAPDAMLHATPPPQTPAARATPQASIPHPAAQTGETPAPASKGLPIPIIVGAVVVVALIIVAVIALPSITANGEVPTTLIPATAAVPTPFASAQVVRGDQYTISIPIQWIPPEGKYDLSEGDRTIHVWQDPNLQAYIGLTLMEADVSTDQAYQAAVANYTETYYAEAQADHLTLIGLPSTATDHTIRQSYRLTGDVQPPFPPGQVDVFYLARAPYLVVLEMYSSDAMGNRQVDTFQKILDSLQVNG